VVEGRKFDLQSANLEISALKAQLTVGSRAASDIQTAGDRIGHSELNP
jgi:hypothetical protein